MSDFTALYLAGSIVCGLVMVWWALLVLGNQGRLTAFSKWLMGLFWFWPVASLVILFELLPNSVPAWLPLAYLGYCLFELLCVAWGMWSDWGRVKGIFEHEISGKGLPLSQWPALPKWDFALHAALGAALVVASFVVLMD